LLEPPDVEAVALGPDGLIAGMKPGAAYFDLSTNSPSSLKKLHAAFAEKGVHMLDAPVSGGPAGAHPASSHLGRRGRKHLQPVQSRARRDWR
jgi:3-hydroxyisobutyrate dehydrogenase-like beta-hydroxyacid dehydrogenase